MLPILPVAFPFQASVKESDDIPAIKCWRRFEDSDYEGIRQLIRPITEELFGPDVYTEDTIEFSSHQLVMLNQNDEIISCLCLREYPNITSIHPEEWPKVLNRHYKLNSMTPENTLFVHLFMWDIRYNWNMLTYYMKSLYLCMFRLQYIVFLSFPGIALEQHITNYLFANHFHKVTPISCKNMRNCQTLYVSNRESIVPRLVARYATPEDNDDIIEMLDQGQPRLRQVYGDYFIANMLLNPQNQRKMIVLEHKNTPMGVFCMNDLISYVNLTLKFEIGQYHNFCKVACEADYNYSTDSLAHDVDKWHYDRIKMETSEVGAWLSNLTISFSINLSEKNDDLVQIVSDISSGTSCSSSSTVIHDGDGTEMDTLRSAVWRTTVHYADVALTDTKIRDAFLIELHAIHNDFDERFVVDMLGAAFQAYPTYTYALLTLPTTQRYIPLLSYFVKVIPRPNYNLACGRAVYALHRNALLSDLSVRRATLADRMAIHNFLRRMHESAYYVKEIIDAIEEQATVDELHVFVTIVEEQMVGICILRSGDPDLEEFSYLYDLDTYIDHKVHLTRQLVCRLKLMVLHPAFMIRLPTIISEYFRLSHNCCMFFTIHDQVPHYQHQLVNSMLCDMVPILPRRLVEYDPAKLEPYHNRPPNCMIPPYGPPYALYMHNNHLCTSQKLPVNTRIVIVGGGQTTMSFFERLIFGQKNMRLLFTSLTLCSTYGFSEFDAQNVDPMAEMFRLSSIYSEEYTRRLSFRSWVNIIFGTMTAINRKEKYVTIDSKRRVYYDRLYLFCGLQYDVPIRLPTPAKPLKNVMYVKHCIDAEYMLLKVKESVRRSHYHFIVYGSTRLSFTCLRTLLLLVEEPERIVYIRPRTAGHIGLTTVFNDTFVDNVMEKFLTQSGIVFYDGYDVIDWKIEANNTVSFVYAENEFRVLTLPCSLLLSFEKMVITRKTIKVLRQAGLVFDGQLIVNDDSQTSDPSIFAGGPMTKYRVRMHANDWQQAFLSSYEIGTLLADRAMNELSPFAPEANVKSAKVVHTRKRQPKLRYAALPYGLHFMSVYPPGKPIAIDLARTLETYGNDLITGEDRVTADDDFDFSNVNYCRINITDGGYVNHIVTLTTYKPNLLKFMKMWNRTENSFMNLRMRYESGAIHDLNEFFMQPWFYVLIHDRYERDVLLPVIKTFHNDSHVRNQITYEITDRILANKWQNLSERQRGHIVDMYITSHCNLHAEHTFVDFIKEHEAELPIIFETPLLPDGTRWSSS